MKLSIVDLAVVQPGETPAQALEHSLNLAVHAEHLGYERIWFSEHHSTAVASRSPDVLVAAAAARTHKIRIGSGSVLLNHYSAYRVAESFCTLSELYPGRIDLGVGRATSGPVIDRALQQDRSKPFHANSDNQLSELVNWLQGSFEADSVLASIPIPSMDHHPELHVSGSSAWSGRAAGRRGLRYVFASFFNPIQTRECVEVYKSNFEPSSGSAGVRSPETRLGLHVVCADTELEARRQIAPVHIMYRYLRMGQLQFRLPTPDQAIEMLGAVPELERYQRFSCVPPRYIAGTFEQVAEQLDAIRGDLLVDEFVIQDMTTNLAARLHSYELLAGMFEQSSVVKSTRRGAPGSSAAK